MKTALIFAILGLGCSPETLDVGTASSAIHGNTANTTVDHEALESLLGHYPEVGRSWVPGYYCSGTVIGPYAMLTASHCTPSGAAGLVEAGGTYFVVANTFLSPYLTPAYWPAWWNALNQQQKASGGRQDDWPAMHDMEVRFVPGLTPEKLAEWGMVPAAIDPRAPGNRFHVIGTASGADRRWVAARYVPAIPNTITQNPRDGFLSLDNTTAGYGIVDPGDSGGPTMGSSVFPIYKQTLAGTIREFEIEEDHHLMAVTHGGTNSSDTAPLSWTTGSAVTRNQGETALRNALWLAAMRDDADGDGLPLACDPDPASPIWAGNRCPDPVGVPQAQTKTVPVGSLMCAPGYFAAGLSGRSGALVDQLQVRCRARSCFDESGACEEYLTDAFGGDGGGAFDMYCPSSQVMVGIGGSEVPGDLMTGLQIQCLEFGAVALGNSGGAVQGWTGGQGGAPVSRRCGQYQSLVGFEARSSDARWITGLQPICNSDASDYTRYAGGRGGGTRGFSCPAGFVGVGTLQRALGSTIDHFGLLCASRARVQSGAALGTNDLWVLHASFHDDATGNLYPTQQVSYGRYLTTQAPNVVETRCPTGRALTGMTVHARTLVDRVDTLLCTGYSRWGWLSGTTTVQVQVGGGGGGSQTLYCPYSEVGGLFTRSGWLLDGVSLRCLPH
jgi:hypothetical protein